MRHSVLLGPPWIYLLLLRKTPLRPLRLTIRFGPPAARRGPPGERSPEIVCSRHQPRYLRAGGAVLFLVTRGGVLARPSQGGLVVLESAELRGELGCLERPVHPGLTYGFK